MATRRQAFPSAQFKAKEMPQKNGIQSFQRGKGTLQIGSECGLEYSIGNSSLRARKQETQSYGHSKERLNSTATDGRRKGESEPQSYGKERSGSQHLWAQSGDLATAEKRLKPLRNVIT